MCNKNTKISGIFYNRTDLYYQPPYVLFPDLSSYENFLFPKLKIATIQADATLVLENICLDDMKESMQKFDKGWNRARNFQNSAGHRVSDCLLFYISFYLRRLKV